MTFALLLPAAGSGERLGAPTAKALIGIGGEPMFIRAMKPFLESADCIEVIVAAPKAYIGEFEKQVAKLADNRVRVIAGGATRQESVGRALEALAKACDAVLVHDAARPFTTKSLIESVLNGLENCAACLPALAVKDTIKLVEVESGFVESTLQREKLFLMQTPQAIRTDLFRQAHQLAVRDHWTATDDTALIEHYRLGKIRIVPGTETNFKITTPDDLQRAMQLPG